MKKVPTPDGTFYVTRDRLSSGVLAACVEVWTQRPRPIRGTEEDGNPLSVVWLDRSYSLGERWGTWSLAEAQGAIGNAVPGTERECIVVGGAR